MSVVHLSAFLAFKQLSFSWPNGDSVLTLCDTVFNSGCIGLVGANGSGKSTVLRLLAGDLLPQSGVVERQGSLVYLPQQTIAAQGSIAAACGLSLWLAAWQRLQQGVADNADYAVLEQDWAALDTLQQRLCQHGWPHLSPQDRAACLSGGQLQRLALETALAKQADFLLLDEPGNHLDSGQRQWLAAQIAAYPHTVVLVSHDRSLLRGADAILSLNQGCLKQYSGDIDVYLAAQVQEQANAIADYQHARATEKKARQRWQQQHDRQQKRTAQAQRNRQTCNQSKLILDRQQEQSQQAQGKLRQQQQQFKQQLQNQIQQAHSALPPAQDKLFTLPQSTVPPRRQVLQTQSLRLSYTAIAEVADLYLHGAFRLHIQADNGAGKSTLLRVCAGLQAPAAGAVQTFVPLAYIDQQASLLDNGTNVLTQLQQQNTMLPEAVLRQYLHQLGLAAAQLCRPCGVLSGGERIKAALAVALWRQPAAQLLLLDEPTNHLDLPSVQALERALADFSGAMMVVSHDADFVRALKPSGRLHILNGHWCLDKTELPGNKAV